MRRENGTTAQTRLTNQGTGISVEKIDIHTHILPERLPDFKKKYGYGGFVNLEHHKPGCARMMIDAKHFRDVEQNLWDPKARLADCDAEQISMQVLSTVPVMFSYWAKPNDAYDLSRFLNDHIAGVVEEHPSRFRGLGTLPLQDAGLAIRELERCMKELKLSGIEIGSHVNDWNLDDQHLFPVFQVAEELGAAIFVHPWDMMSKEKMPRYWLPWLVGMPAEVSLAICSMIFGGVFDKLPRLRVAFAHGGGSFPGTLGRIEHGFQSRPDLCATNIRTGPRTYLDKFYLDSITHDSVMLRYLMDILGPKQIALGSDYPFPLGETHPGAMISSLGLDPATKARLYSGTAREWLAI